MQDHKEPAARRGADKTKRRIPPHSLKGKRDEIDAN
jgi:hypothetical protein